MLSLHKTAAVFIAPEWAIDDDEKTDLARAIVDVQKHYAPVVDGKALDWFNLLQCLALVYGTRLYAIHDRRREERRRAAPPPSQRPSPPPMQTATRRQEAQPAAPPVSENNFIQPDPARNVPQQEAPPDLRRTTIPGVNIDVEFPENHPLFKKPQ